MIFNSVISVSYYSHYIWRYDKYIHFVEFFILGILVVNIFIPNISRVKLAFSLILIASIAALDESVQFFFPNRIPDNRDFIVDVQGGFIGSMCSFIYYKYIKKT